MDRKFENTGSHISTMYKDLGISMGMAKEIGVPMFTAAAPLNYSKPEYPHTLKEITGQ